MYTAFEFSPIDWRIAQIGHIEPTNRRLLVLDGFLSVFVPFVGSRNPKPLGKLGGLVVFVRKLTARSRQKAIHSRFVYRGIFGKTFALYRPIVSLFGKCHQINSRIVATKIVSCRKFVPKPYFFEQIGIFPFGQQKGLHEPFESVAFVALRKWNVTVFSK